MSIKFKPVELDKTYEAFEVLEDNQNIGMVIRHKVRNRWAATMNTVPTNPLDYEHYTKEDVVALLQMCARRFISG